VWYFACADRDGWLSTSALCQLINRRCRKARSQRNHLAHCYHTWLSLKVYAQRMGLTLMQDRTSIFASYLRAELLCLTIAAC
jgi:hypothetical protein